MNLHHTAQLNAVADLLAGTSMCEFLSNGGELEELELVAQELEQWNSSWEDELPAQELSFEEYDS